jgi:sigma-B regulation protein RsbU (phosphoserine phosphatase)
MKIVGRAARIYSRSILRGLVLLCMAAAPAALVAADQATAAQRPQESTAKDGVAPAGIHGILQLDGPWRFQMGDNPQWADPGFDDSSWPTVTLGKTLTEQGIEPYSGYAWYRLRLKPQQLQPGSSTRGPSLELLVTSYNMGQLAVYVNGIEAGHSRGMTDKPVMYQSPPFVVKLSREGPDGTTLVAIRSWTGFGIPISHSLLHKVELGSPEDVADRLDLAVARHWDQHVIAGMIVSFLFLCVAALATILYLSQRNHSEYLWLGLMCLSVAVTGSVELAYGLALLPFPVFEVVHLWTGRIFMAVTLEFVLRFTGYGNRTIIRTVQVCFLLLPVASLLGFEQTYAYLSMSAEVTFCTMVCVLLYRAWRRGFREAGVMLVPFFMAATADSIDTILDYAAGRHWLPNRFASHHFHFGPIESGMGPVVYTVFLASLIAVILYRFLRVSQEEQHSSAEIAAARSVQSLLIPTQLPSNKHFMLESAYLPVNGVGGDFFQVLPLDDGSMLIVVGDVSGKGLQAAMNASTLVGALRNELSHDPATILDHLNHVMLGAGAAPNADAVASFATCLCARVYPDGSIAIANAGHLSPYRDGREMELSPGLPLGVIAGIQYEQATFQLTRGDRLVFLSDGVVEATNAQGELFGFERTQQVSHEPANYIAQIAQRFGQNDDITVISLYVASTAARVVNHEAVLSN